MVDHTITATQRRMLERILAVGWLGDRLDTNALIWHICQDDRSAYAAAGAELDDLVARDLLWTAGPCVIITPAAEALLATGSQEADPR